MKVTYGEDRDWYRVEETTRNLVNYYYQKKKLYHKEHQNFYWLTEKEAQEKKVDLLADAEDFLEENPDNICDEYLCDYGNDFVSFIYEFEECLEEEGEF